eukprot:TRINITY_DN3300_c0_g1_i1.p1 TRINITY_DN3300_c0_g1~~TRINITY_DN3300_c0_g1_i1.p1  ORF type:complete len:199 (-),score=-19.80 TRINITY_DN3300_c0_g1_i1:229-825(-)
MQQRIFNLPNTSYILTPQIKRAHIIKTRIFLPKKSYLYGTNQQQTDPISILITQKNAFQIIKNNHNHELLLHLAELVQTKNQNSWHFLKSIYRLPEQKHKTKNQKQPHFQLPKQLYFYSITFTIKYKSKKQQRKMRNKNYVQKQNNHLIAFLTLSFQGRFQKNSKSVQQFFPLSLFIPTKLLCHQFNYSNRGFSCFYI